MRPTNYPCRLDASVMTVGRTSQSRPSNMIVDDSHNPTIKLPARIYTFGYIGLRTGATTRPGKRLLFDLSEPKLVGLILLTENGSSQAGWMCQFVDTREVVMNGSECLSARPGICAFVICVCAITRHVGSLKLNGIYLGFRVSLSCLVFDPLS